MSSTDDPTVHPAVAKAAAYSWRILVIAAVVIGAVILMGRLLVVVVPVAIAALLARALWPVFVRLRSRGLKPALAAALSMVAFVVVIGGVLGVVGVAFAGEVDDLGPTVTEGIDDVTDWLVDDSPWDISRADVVRWRGQAGDLLSDFLRAGSESESGSGASVLSGAAIAGEVVVGFFLALIVTFFLLKDGERIRDRALTWLRSDRRPASRRAGDRAWDAIGGYLRGAAGLGLLEGVIIGLTMLLVGGRLVVPVILLTFVLAFVPIVGAVTAGVIAVLVTLVTAGAFPAMIVAIVALVVQQLDNDFLAPVIYGKSLDLHPLVILLGIAAGGALFGFVGTFLAVPVLAAVINAVRGYQGRSSTDDDADDATASTTLAT